MACKHWHGSHTPQQMSDAGGTPAAVGTPGLRYHVHPPSAPMALPLLFGNFQAHVRPRSVWCGCRSLNLDHIMQMLHDVSSGLHHLHGLALVHCDIKSNNVSPLPCPCLHLCMALQALSALHCCANHVCSPLGCGPAGPQLVTTSCPSTNRLSPDCTVYSDALQPQLPHGKGSACRA